MPSTSNRLPRYTTFLPGARERRLWFWLKDTATGVSVVMAMSSARKTFDFEKEFAQTRDTVGATLGVKPADAADPAHGSSAASAPPSAGSQDSTR